MQVRGFAIECIEALSKIKEMLSCPELFLGFRPNILNYSIGKYRITVLEKSKQCDTTEVNRYVDTLSCLHCNSLIV